MAKTAVTVSAHELNAGDVFEAIARAAKLGLDSRADEVMLQFNGQDIRVDPAAPWAACGRWLHSRVCEYVSGVMTEVTKLEGRLADLKAQSAREKR